MSRVDELIKVLTPLEGQVYTDNLYVWLYENVDWGNSCYPSNPHIMMEDATRLDLIRLVEVEDEFGGKTTGYKIQIDPSLREPIGVQTGYKIDYPYSKGFPPGESLVPHLTSPTEEEMTEIQKTLIKGVYPRESSRDASQQEVVLLRLHLMQAYSAIKDLSERVRKLEDREEEFLRSLRIIEDHGQLRVISIERKKG